MIIIYQNTNSNPIDTDDHTLSHLSHRRGLLIIGKPVDAVDRTSVRKVNLVGFDRSEVKAGGMLFVNKRKGLVADMIRRLQLPKMRGQKQAQFKSKLSKVTVGVNVDDHGNV